MFGVEHRIAKAGVQQRVADAADVGEVADMRRAIDLRPGLAQLVQRVRPERRDRDVARRAAARGEIRRTSAGTSSIHWMHRFENSTSTLASASGSARASALTRISGRSQPGLIRRSIGNARSSATTCADFQRVRIAARPGPARSRRRARVAGRPRGSPGARAGAARPRAAGPRALHSSPPRGRRRGAPGGYRAAASSVGDPLGERDDRARDLRRMTEKRRVARGDLEELAARTVLRCPARRRGRNEPVAPAGDPQVRYRQRSAGARAGRSTAARRGPARAPAAPDRRARTRAPSARAIRRARAPSRAFPGRGSVRSSAR